MNSLFSVSIVLLMSSYAFAQTTPTPTHPEYLTVTITDITEQYLNETLHQAVPTPTPIPTKPPGNAGNPPPIFDPLATPTPYDPNNPYPYPDPNYPYPDPSYPYPSTYPPYDPGNTSVLSHLITLGGKIWDFVLSAKPTATYQSIRSSVVPAGVQSWTQLTGWSRPVSKVYHVEFKTILGKSAGGFDYRITFLYGGNTKGRGKFLGQISFAPVNIKLHTDRSIDIKAEMSEPLNYGTEKNPVAAIQLQVIWASPTTTRYQMNSAEYFIYGNGDFQDLTNGTTQRL